MKSTTNVMFILFTRAGDAGLRRGELSIFRCWRSSGAYFLPALTRGASGSTAADSCHLQRRA